MDPARRCTWLLLLVLLVKVVTTHVETATAGSVDKKADRSTRLADLEYGPAEDALQPEEEGDYTSGAEPVSLRSKRTRSASQLKRNRFKTYLTLVGVLAAFLTAGYIVARYSSAKAGLWKELLVTAGEEEAGEKAAEQEDFTRLLQIGKSILPGSVAVGLAVAAAYLLSQYGPAANVRPDISPKQ